MRMIREYDKVDSLPAFVESSSPPSTTLLLLLSSDFGDFMMSAMHSSGSVVAAQSQPTVGIIESGRKATAEFSTLNCRQLMSVSAAVSLSSPSRKLQRQEEKDMGRTHYKSDPNGDNNAPLSEWSSVMASEGQSRDKWVAHLGSKASDEEAVRRFCQMSSSLRPSSPETILPVAAAWGKINGQGATNDKSPSSDQNDSFLLRLRTVHLSAIYVSRCGQAIPYLHHSIRKALDGEERGKRNEKHNGGPSHPLKIEIRVLDYFSVDFRSSAEEEIQTIRKAQEQRQGAAEEERELARGTTAHSSAHDSSSSRQSFRYGHQKHTPSSSSASAFEATPLATACRAQLDQWYRRAFADDILSNGWDHQTYRNRRGMKTQRGSDGQQNFGNKNDTLLTKIEMSKPNSRTGTSSSSASPPPSLVFVVGLGPSRTFRHLKTLAAEADAFRVWSRRQYVGPTNAGELGGNENERRKELAAAAPHSNITAVRPPRHFHEDDEVYCDYLPSGVAPSLPTGRIVGQWGFTDAVFGVWKGLISPPTVVNGNDDDDISTTNNTDDTDPAKGAIVLFEHYNQLKLVARDDDAGKARSPTPSQQPSPNNNNIDKKAPFSRSLSMTFSSELPLELAMPTTRVPQWKESHRRRKETINPLDDHNPPPSSSSPPPHSSRLPSLRSLAMCLPISFYASVADGHGPMTAWLDEIGDAMTTKTSKKRREKKSVENGYKNDNKPQQKGKGSSSSDSMHPSLGDDDRYDDAPWPLPEGLNATWVMDYSLPLLLGGGDDRHSSHTPPLTLPHGLSLDDDVERHRRPYPYRHAGGEGGGTEASDTPHGGEINQRRDNQSNGKKEGGEEGRPQHQQQQQLSVGQAMESTARKIIDEVGCLIPPTAAPIGGTHTKPQQSMSPLFRGNEDDETLFFPSLVDGVSIQCPYNQVMRWCGDDNQESGADSVDGEYKRRPTAHPPPPPRLLVTVMGAEESYEAILKWLLRIQQYHWGGGEQMRSPQRTGNEEPASARPLAPSPSPLITIYVLGMITLPRTDYYQQAQFERWLRAARTSTSAMMENVHDAHHNDSGGQAPLAERLTSDDLLFRIRVQFTRAAADVVDDVPQVPYVDPFSLPDVLFGQGIGGNRNHAINRSSISANENSFTHQASRMGEQNSNSKNDYGSALGTKNPHLQQHSAVDYFNPALLTKALFGRHYHKILTHRRVTEEEENTARGNEEEGSEKVSERKERKDNPSPRHLSKFNPKKHLLEALRQLSFQQPRKDMREFFIHLALEITAGDEGEDGKQQSASPRKSNGDGRAATDDRYQKDSGDMKHDDAEQLHQQYHETIPPLGVMRHSVRSAFDPDFVSIRIPARAPKMASGKQRSSMGQKQQHSTAFHQRDVRQKEGGIGGGGVCWSLIQLREIDGGYDSGEADAIGRSSDGNTSESAKRKKARQSNNGLFLTFQTTSTSPSASALDTQLQQLLLPQALFYATSSFSNMKDNNDNQLSNMNGPPVNGKKEEGDGDYSAISFVPMNAIQRNESYLQNCSGAHQRDNDKYSFFNPIEALLRRDDGSFPRRSQSQLNYLNENLNADDKIDPLFQKAVSKFNKHVAGGVNGGGNSAATNINEGLIVQNAMCRFRFAFRTENDNTLRDIPTAVLVGGLGSNSKDDDQMSTPHGSGIFVITEGGNCNDGTRSDWAVGAFAPPPPRMANKNPSSPSDSATATIITFLHYPWVRDNIYHQHNDNIYPLLLAKFIVEAAYGTSNSLDENNNESDNNKGEGSQKLGGITAAHSSSLNEQPKRESCEHGSPRSLHNTSTRIVLLPSDRSVSPLPSFEPILRSLFSSVISTTSATRGKDNNMSGGRGRDNARANKVGGLHHAHLYQEREPAYFSSAVGGPTSNILVSGRPPRPFASDLRTAVTYQRMNIAGSVRDSVLEKMAKHFDGEGKEVTENPHKQTRTPIRNPGHYGGRLFNASSPPPSINIVVITRKRTREFLSDGALLAIIRSNPITVSMILSRQRRFGRQQSSTSAPILKKSAAGDLISANSSNTSVVFATIPPLQQHISTCCDGLSYADQVRIVNSADILIGTHGAGLFHVTNLDPKRYPLVVHIATNRLPYHEQNIIERLVLLTNGKFKKKKLRKIETDRLRDPEEKTKEDEWETECDTCPGHLETGTSNDERVDYLSTVSLVPLGANGAKWQDSFDMPVEEIEHVWERAKERYSLG